MTDIETKLEFIIHKRTLEVQKIDDGMEEAERWGRGAYERHRKAMLEQELKDLEYLRSGVSMAGRTRHDE